MNLIQLTEQRSKEEFQYQIFRENLMITYITENSAEIIAVATATVTLASLISAMTPNETDNKITSILAKVLNWLALNVGKAKPK